MPTPILCHSEPRLTSTRICCSKPSAHVMCTSTAPGRGAPAPPPPFTTGDMHWGMRPICAGDAGAAHTVVVTSEEADVGAAASVVFGIWIGFVLSLQSLDDRTGSASSAAMFQRCTHSHTLKGEVGAQFTKTNKQQQWREQQKCHATLVF